MSFLRKSLQAVLLAMLTTGWIAAQTGGSGGSGAGAGAGTGGTGSKGGNPAASTPTVPTVQPRNIPPLQQPQQEQRRLVYLTGRVVYDDGTPAGNQISIERVCNGRARREGYTDSTGHFSISLGQDLGVMQDASVGAGDMGYDPFGRSSNMNSPGGMSQGVTERELMSCELRAAASGAWSDTIVLAGHHSMDSPEVGTIVLHRMGKVEGTRISVTSMQAPKDARKAFEHGQKAAKKQKWPEAQQDLEKAVGVYPRYAEAWVELGQAYLKQNRIEDGRKAFEQALTIDPKFMLPYFHLAVMAAAERDWTRVADLTDKALALDAFEYPAAYYYNSVAYFELHKLDQAEKSARQARRLDSQYNIPKIDLVLSGVLLAKKDYSGAAQQLREFLKHAPNGPDADRARAELQDTEQKIASTK